MWKFNVKMWQYVNDVKVWEYIVKECEYVMFTKRMWVLCIVKECEYVKECK